MKTEPRRHRPSTVFPQSGMVCTTCSGDELQQRDLAARPKLSALLRAITGAAIASPALS
jgi:hypothetical protein